MSKKKPSLGGLFLLSDELLIIHLVTMKDINQFGHIFKTPTSMIELRDKLENMIDNYCEHERLIAYACQECLVDEYRCHKCGEIFYRGNK